MSEREIKALFETARLIAETQAAARTDPRRTIRKRGGPKKKNPYQAVGISGKSEVADLVGSWSALPGPRRQEVLRSLVAESLRFRRCVLDDETGTPRGPFNASWDEGGDNPYDVEPPEADDDEIDE
jgi:hypothetical protein